MEAKDWRGGQCAGEDAQRVLFIDHRPLAATIFYFPPTETDGDVDNIVKLIIDGMITIIYPDDQLIERVVVQKFEPGIEPVFRSDGGPHPLRRPSRRRGLT